MDAAESSILEVQTRAYNRILGALNDLLTQEIEIDKRIEEKKQYLEKIRREKSIGQDKKSKPKEIINLEIQLDSIEKEISELKLTYQSKLKQMHDARTMRDPSTHNIDSTHPPPLPPKINTISARPLNDIIPDIDSDQWRCPVCLTINHCLMPMCEKCNRNPNLP